MYHPKIFENVKEGTMYLLEIASILDLMIKQCSDNQGIKWHLVWNHYVSKSGPKSGDQIKWGLVNQMSVGTHMIWFDKAYILNWNQS